MGRDENVYPLDTIVRLIKTGQFARITKLCYLQDVGRDGKPFGFLNYLGEIEGRAGEYALYPDDIDLEALPGGNA